MSDSIVEIPPFSSPPASALPPAPLPSAVPFRFGIHLMWHFGSVCHFFESFSHLFPEDMQVFRPGELAKALQCQAHGVGGGPNDDPQPSDHPWQSCQCEEPECFYLIDLHLVLLSLLGYPSSDLSSSSFIRFLVNEFSVSPEVDRKLFRHQVKFLNKYDYKGLTVFDKEVVADGLSGVHYHTLNAPQKLLVLFHLTQLALSTPLISEAIPTDRSECNKIFNERPLFGSDNEDSLYFVYFNDKIPFVHIYKESRNDPAAGKEKKIEKKEEEKNGENAMKTSGASLIPKKIQPPAKPPAVVAGAPGKKSGDSLGPPKPRGPALGPPFAIIHPTPTLFSSTGWNLVASNRDELEVLIMELEGQNNEKSTALALRLRSEILNQLERLEFLSERRQRRMQRLDLQLANFAPDRLRRSRGAVNYAEKDEDEIPVVEEILTTRRGRGSKRENNQVAPEYMAEVEAEEAEGDDAVESEESEYQQSEGVEEDEDDGDSAYQEESDSKRGNKRQRQRSNSSDSFVGAPPSSSVPHLDALARTRGSHAALAGPSGLAVFPSASDALAIQEIEEELKRKFASKQKEEEEEQQQQQQLTNQPE